MYEFKLYILNYSLFKNKQNGEINNTIRLSKKNV